MSLFSATAQAGEAKAVFAGGCFWCMQPAFDNTEGVTATSVGYTGGEANTATYKQIGSGKTGHFEAIQVSYDPDKVTFDKLVRVFFESIDPFDPSGQFADKGSQYETAIFYANEDEKQAAQNEIANVEKQFGKKVAVKLLPAKPFYDAEEYHQKYYQKNATHYNMYKYGSGRASGLKELWQKEGAK